MVQQFLHPSNQPYPLPQAPGLGPGVVKTRASGHLNDDVMQDATGVLDPIRGIGQVAIDLAALEDGHDMQVIVVQYPRQDRVSAASPTCPKASKGELT